MKKHYYLVHIQFLGFRFHGWQKQPNLKTVHFMVDKTLDFIFQHTDYKTHGVSRTDSKVSANHYIFELFVNEELNLKWFEKNFAANLPNDISYLKIEKVQKEFNLISNSKTKEYQYLFCIGQKPHPFATAVMTYFKGDIDISMMMEGALLFEGQHNFARYCSKPTEHTQFERTISHCSISKNSQYTASFFPNDSYILTIRSKGFLRYQVRFIMGQLVRLGRGEINLEDIEESLSGNDHSPLRNIVPGSGLILNKIVFEDGYEVL